MQHQPRGSWQLRAQQARPSTSPTLRAVSAAALFRRRTSSARRALSSRSRLSVSCCAFLRTGRPGSEQRQHEVLVQEATGTPLLANSPQMVKACAGLELPLPPGKRSGVSGVPHTSASAALLLTCSPVYTSGPLVAGNFAAHGLSFLHSPALSSLLLAPADGCLLGCLGLLLPGTGLHQQQRELHAVRDPAM